MLYPEARYFTPNGTCKNSICWNGLWNMSALAEGSRARAVFLAQRITCCQLHPMGWKRERDAAVAVWQQGCGSRSLYHLSESPRERRRGAEREKERSYHTIQRMLLNVSVVERLQIISSSEYYKRCHMHTAATFALSDENNNGQQAGGQMCHQFICAVMQDKKQSKQVHSAWDFHSWKKWVSVFAQAYV